MGDPRKLRNKFESPRKVWDEKRIKKEKKLSIAFGLKNTREIWVAQQKLKKARKLAMKFLSLGEKGELLGQTLMNRLVRYGIINKDKKLDDILSLSIENFLGRRLQSIILKKGMARTPKQARQLIVHGFISIKGIKTRVPSYVVLIDEENDITYSKPIDINIKEDEPADERKTVQKPQNIAENAQDITKTTKIEEPKTG